MENKPSPAPLHQVVGQLRELMAKATPGPWHNSHMEWDESGRVIMAGGRDRIKVNWNGGTWRKQCEADAELIATTVNALPALLAISEAAQAIIDAGDLDIQAPIAERKAREQALRTALSLLPNTSDKPPAAAPSGDRPREGGR